MEKKLDLESLKSGKSEIRAKNHEKVRKNMKKHEKSKTKYSAKGTKISKYREIHHNITVYSNPIASRKTIRVSPDRSFISGENFELFLDGGNTYSRSTHSVFVIGVSRGLKFYRKYF